MIKRTPFLVLSFLLTFFTACDKDDEGANPDDSKPLGNNTGAADLNISGAVTADLGDYATWEITDDKLLRIRVGGEFPRNIVMNYRLGSANVSDFETGSYTAVSATYTGQPNDEIAFQYNGDDPQFPDSGTITFNAVSNNILKGTIDVSISPPGGSSSQVTGTFEASSREE